MAEDYLKIKKNTMTLKYLMTKLFHEQFLRLILIICKLIKFLQTNYNMFVFAFNI